MTGCEVLRLLRVLHGAAGPAALRRAGGLADLSAWERAALQALRLQSVPNFDHQMNGTDGVLEHVSAELSSIPAELLSSVTEDLVGAHQLDFQPAADSDLGPTFLEQLPQLPPPQPKLLAVLNLTLMLFFLAALVAHGSPGTTGGARPWLGGLFYLCSLLSKESGAALPAVLFCEAGLGGELTDLGPDLCRAQQRGGFAVPPHCALDLGPAACVQACLAAPCSPAPAAGLVTLVAAARGPPGLLGAPRAWAYAAARRGPPGIAARSKGTASALTRERAAA